MIVLGGVTLNDNMVWLERYHSSGVAQSIRRTVGGKPIVFSGPLSAGVPITLEATEEYGWLQKSVVAQLIALAAVFDAIYTLNFNGVEYSVAFRHVDDPAVEMTPIVPRTADAVTDYMIGQIKLITL